VIVLSCGVAVVISFIGLLRLLNPILDPNPPASHFEPNRAALEQVTDALAKPFSPLQIAAGFVLLAVGLWLVYRMFMRCAEDLDETGHWNRIVARRHGRKA
jgi:hypothetical protein